NRTTKAPPLPGTLPPGERENLREEYRMMETSTRAPGLPLPWRERVGERGGQRLASRPEHPTAQDSAHLRNLELACHVAERTVKNAAFAVATLPDHRHNDAIDPVCVLTRERGCRKHLVRGVHVHVVLFGAVTEILDA